MNDKIILTGDRPTGKLHLGHYVGTLKKRVELQNDPQYKQRYVFIADLQALTDHARNPQLVRENVTEVALDYLGAGLTPDKTTLFVQSQIPELAELTMYYLNLVTVERLQRNPTVKAEIKQKKEMSGETGVPAGFLTYPISQAADITAFDADVVPVGEDQIPVLEQTREVVRSFNALYGETLKEPQAMLPDRNACRRLPGTDGAAKMSKTLGNAIYLSDDEAAVSQKIIQVYTDPLHIRVSDPGHLKGNVLFVYLDAFCRDAHFAAFLPDYRNLDELKEHYKRGGLGDIKVKKFLNAILQEELSPIRERRKYYEARKDEVYHILYEGGKRARAAAAGVLDRVRRAIGVNYF
ncbi:MAG: tryptophan--tRNA ligase [Clostridiales bacterium]|jgi:tryptophanyl-tRNA synthetase|nr:tryptophan--tRNA ligase [Clostridiales bacterium]